MRLFCINCNKDVEAELIKGKELYPNRDDLAKLNFYKCPSCNNHIGCHQKTTRPLGKSIPTKELRLARRKLHEKIDPIWKEGKMTRVALYRLISKRLGYSYHNGDLSSMMEFMNVWKVVDSIEKELVCQ